MLAEEELQKDRDLRLLLMTRASQSDEKGFKEFMGLMFPK